MFAAVHESSYGTSATSRGEPGMSAFEGGAVVSPTSAEKRGAASGPAAAPRAGSPRSPGARPLGDVLASFGGRMRGEAAKGVARKSELGAVVLYSHGMSMLTRQRPKALAPRRIYRPRMLHTRRYLAALRR